MTENILAKKLTGSYSRKNTYKLYFVSKLVLTCCEEKKCSGDKEKLLKFEDKSCEFATV